MKELCNGIYRTGKLEESSWKNSLVLVHPWFNLYGGKYKTLRGNDYLSDLSLFIQNFNNEIVLFEQKNDFFKSSEKIVDLRKGKGVNVICTYNNSPKLLGTDYSVVFPWIKTKGTESFDFGGGYVEICLNEIYTFFKKEKIPCKINPHIAFWSYLNNKNIQNP